MRIKRQANEAFRARRNASALKRLMRSIIRHPKNAFTDPGAASENSFRDAAKVARSASA
jgi:hypothetical protein